MKTTITLSIERRHVVALVLAILAAPLLLGAVHVLADALESESTVPNVLTYDGFLEQNGEPVDGEYTAKLRLWQVDESNNEEVQVWPGSGTSATRSALVVKQGHFFITFPKEDETALPEDMFEGLSSSQSIKLDIQLQDNNITNAPLINFDKKISLTSVPYALRAKVAERAKEATETEKVIIRANGSAYSVNAVYVGSTAGRINTGSFNSEGETTGKIIYPEGATAGYASAKRACEAAFNSDTAHMCTKNEMLISAQLGLFVSGNLTYEWIASSEGNPMGEPVDYDCKGYSSDAELYASSDREAYGQAWYSGLFAYPVRCNTNQSAVACCDIP